MSTQFDPNTAQNLGEIEKQFAVKTVEQAQTYWNLLEKIPPKQLKLTKLDDEIYVHTMESFPELLADEHAKLVVLDEDWLKSKDGKNRWRLFINVYENKVKDYNFGSLIRTDARKEYAEDNTIFVTRMQFYAIEIAWNRLGLNDEIHKIAKAEAEKEAKKKEEEKAKAGKGDGNGKSWIGQFVPCDRDFKGLWRSVRRRRLCATSVCCALMMVVITVEMSFKDSGVGKAYDLL